MLIVALFALAVAALAVLAAFRLIRADRRENNRREQAWEQREATLVDQVCHLAGHPWTPPPRPVRDPENGAKPTAEAEIASRW